MAAVCVPGRGPLEVPSAQIILWSADLISPFPDVTSWLFSPPTNALPISGSSFRIKVRKLEETQRVPAARTVQALLKQRVSNTLSSLNIHCFGCHCKATAAAERLSTEQCCKALQDKK